MSKNKDLAPDLYLEEEVSWDLDNILLEESKEAQNNSVQPTTQQPIEDRFAYEDITEPTTTSNQDIRVDRADGFSKENDILSQALEDATAITGDEVTTEPVTNNTPTQQVENNTQTTTTEGTDPILTALTILDEFGIINFQASENQEISENMLVDIKNDIMSHNYKVALEDIYNDIEDRDMLTLVSYAIEGGRFVDLPKMKNQVEDNLNWREYPISNITNQKRIVKRYLSKDLNPNDKSHKALISLIPTKIENLVKEMKLKDMAVEAKEFYVNESRRRIEEEATRVIQLKQQEDQRKIEYQETVRRWNQSFENILRERKWSEDKKRTILNETKRLQLQNGGTIPTWKYKQDLILSDPALFQIYLDFISNFDLNNKKFKMKNGSPSTTEATTLLERIKKKSSQASIASTTAVEPERQKPFEMNGLDELY